MREPAEPNNGSLGLGLVNLFRLSDTIKWAIPCYTLMIAIMYVSCGVDNGSGNFGSLDLDQHDLCELHINTMYQSLLKWLRLQMRRANLDYYLILRLHFF